MTKRIFIIFAAIFMGAVASFGQGKSSQADTVFFDKSFLDAGTNPTERNEFHLVPKFYKAGDLAPEQPIALSRAKTEAMNLVKEKPCPLRRDCLNIIYTVDPIYNDEGSITGAIKGTVLIKWAASRRQWTVSYLKYQLVNIDQNAIVFMLETD
jgi:hypothetical protein